MKVSEALERGIFGKMTEIKTWKQELFKKNAFAIVKWSLNFDSYFPLKIFAALHTPGQKYKTTLKNEEKCIVYNC